MWHIELVKNKYESLEDLYSLLQYVFRLNKTADDSRRANIITDDLTGCLPAMIPDINNPDMVYRLMLFIIQRRHKDTPQLVRHRIVSFQASDCILPQDLIPLAQSIASSYVAKGFIAAYGIHADTYCVHIHFVICTVSFTTLNLFYSGYVDNEAMDKVMEDTGIKGKVKNAIRKNEIQGLASAVAIGAGIGFTIGFAVSLAQSGITPDSVKYAFVNGGKSGVASGVQSVVGYGIGRTIGQVATNAIEGVLSNAGLEITANISKMCTMGTVGAITVAVFSTVQFVKLIYRGECLKSAAIQVGKQALFSLSLLAISIAAQGMWGGPAGIIVSIGTGIVIVSYTIADAVHQRTFAEECHIKTIEEYGRLALRHLNELQFA